MGNAAQSARSSMLKVDCRQTTDVLQHKSSVRHTLGLSSRGTAEQLVIMLVPGLNQNFSLLLRIEARDARKRAACRYRASTGPTTERRIRAIESVWRAAGDASCVIWCVVLVFDTFNQLEAALDVILADRSIRIVRVKTGFVRTMLWRRVAVTATSS